VQCTLRHTSAARRTARMQCKSSSSSISDDDIAPARKKAARAKKPVPSRAVPSILKADATDDNAPMIPSLLGTKFQASNKDAARDLVLSRFRSIHPGGKCRCTNSRANYVYTVCKCCNAVMAASLVARGEWWVITRAPLSQPCSGSLLPAAVTAVVPPLPPTPLPVQPPPAAKCCICSDDFQRDVLFECPNPAAHLMCQECFEGDISSQFGEDIQAFINRKCEVMCTYCSCERTRRGIAGDPTPLIPFNMQALVSR